MLVLSDSDVAKVLTMKEAIEAVERAFAEYHRGRVSMPARKGMPR